MNLGSVAATPTVCPDTTKTQLGNDVVLPTGVRSIVAVIPYQQIDAGITAAKAKVTKVTLESHDVAVEPLELLCNPVGAGLGAALDGFVSNPQKYTVNIPVSGGERISIYGQGLQDPTTDPIVGCALVLSNSGPSGQQRKAKVGALTAAGANGVLTSGGTETITGANRIVELVGSLVAGTVTTLEGYGGIFSLRSSEFSPNLPVEFPSNGVAGGLGAAITAINPGLVRYPINLNVANPATIEYFCTLYATTITAAPSFVEAIIYE